MRHPSFPHVHAVVTRTVTSLPKLTQVIRRDKCRERLAGLETGTTTLSQATIGLYLASVHLKRLLTLTPDAAPANQESQASVTVLSQIHQPDNT